MNEFREATLEVIKIVLIVVIFSAAFVSFIMWINNQTEKSECKEFLSQGHEVYIKDTGHLNYGLVCKINYNGVSFDADETTVKNIRLLKLQDRGILLK